MDQRVLIQRKGQMPGFGRWAEVAASHWVRIDLVFSHNRKATLETELVVTSSRLID